MKKAGGYRKRLLTVRVHPGSRLAKVERLTEDEFRVHVLSRPEKGRANRDVAAALADYFGLPAGRVRIVRGESSRVKLVAIEAGD
jgi:uncharacterized protein YggU (UPF0235/DUF167 family)